MANPFYVEPANPLKALMIGQEAYGQARDRRLQDELKQAIAEAGQLWSQGDQKGAIARLIATGDPKMLAGLGHLTGQEATQRHQAAAFGQRNPASADPFTHSCAGAALNGQGRSAWAVQRVISPCGFLF